MRSLVGILILLAVASATQYTPLSKVEYGLSIGDPAGSLHIQAFYDLLCTRCFNEGPDSQASNSVLRDVFKTIIPAKSGIRFTYVFFPLPYHFYSFKVQQGTDRCNFRIQLHPQPQRGCCRTQVHAVCVRHPKLLRRVHVAKPVHQRVHHELLERRQSEPCTM